MTIFMIEKNSFLQKKLKIKIYSKATQVATMVQVSAV